MLGVSLTLTTDIHDYVLLPRAIVKTEINREP